MAPEHTASLLDGFAKAIHNLSFSILPPTLEAPLELNSPVQVPVVLSCFCLCTLTGRGVYGGLESLSLVLRFLSPMADVLVGGRGASSLCLALYLLPQGPRFSPGGTHTVAPALRRQDKR